MNKMSKERGIKMSNLTIHEQNLLECITNKLLNITKEEQIYLLGRIDEMVAKKEEEKLATPQPA